MVSAPALQRVGYLIWVLVNPYTLSFSFIQGKLMDGKIIDSSLSREPLVVDLGKRTVIAGKFQDNCVAQSLAEKSSI